MDFIETGRDYLERLRDRSALSIRTTLFNLPENSKDREVIEIVEEKNGFFLLEYVLLELLTTCPDDSEILFINLRRRLNLSSVSLTKLNNLKEIRPLEESEISVIVIDGLGHYLDAHFDSKIRDIVQLLTQQTKKTKINVIFFRRKITKTSLSWNTNLTLQFKVSDNGVSFREGLSTWKIFNL